MNRSRRRTRAFTLIELLVVIGIITVLLGILVPAVSKMRTHAYTANTANQMNRIAMAINNYQMDFQAYPGALHNKEFAQGGRTATFDAALTDSANYTQTEDCAMALVGGFQFTSGKLTIVPNELGMGPITYTPVASAQKRMNAYLEYRANDFTPRGVGSTLVPVKSLPLGLDYCVDSAAPEFMDQYATPRPIVYVRATVGAPPVPADGSSNPSVYNSKQAGSYSPAFHYDFAAVAPYSNMNSPAGRKKEDQDFGGQVPTAVASTSVIAYFTSPTGRTARGAGAYILMDAGPDRTLGTSDDIVVGSGGGQ